MNLKRNKLFKNFTLLTLLICCQIVFPQVQQGKTSEVHNNNLLIGSWNLISWEYRSKVRTSLSNFTNITFNENQTLVVSYKDSLRKGRWSWEVDKNNIINYGKFYVIMKNSNILTVYSIISVSKDSLAISSIVGKEKSYYKFAK